MGHQIPAWTRLTLHSMSWFSWRGFQKPRAFPFSHCTISLLVSAHLFLPQGPEPCPPSRPHTTPALLPHAQGMLRHTQHWLQSSNHLCFALCSFHCPGARGEHPHAMAEQGKDVAAATVWDWDPTGSSSAATVPPLGLSDTCTPEPEATETRICLLLFPFPGILSSA